MSSPPLPPAPSPYRPPSSGGSRPPSAGPRLPWEERDRLGIGRAFVDTVKLLVNDPSDGFARLRRDGDLTSPMLFGILVSWIAVLLSQLWNMLFASTMRGVFEGLEDIEGFEGFREVFAAPSLLELIITLVFWPVFYVIIVFIGSAVMHLCLLLVGATEKSETGFEGTLKVYAYSTIAWLAVALPFIGSLVASIWYLVLEVFGFAVAHRTSQGRALIAVLIPIILCCVCGLVFSLLFGAVLYQFIQQFGDMP